MREKPRTTNLITLLKKSTSITFTISKDFFDKNLMDSGLVLLLNSAVEELTDDTDLVVVKELVEDDYRITVSLKE